MVIEKGKLVRWIDDKGFGFIKPENGVKANQNPLKYAGKHNYTLPPAIIFCG